MTIRTAQTSVAVARAVVAAAARRARDARIQASMAARRAK